MLSIRKKVLYTVCTTPFAFVTFKAYKWQTRRKAEKIIEIDNRERRLKEAPVLITTNNFKSVSDEWEFRPIEIKGQFDESKYILINKTKEGEPGYHIISPFICCDDTNNQIVSLSVDRGWIPFDYDIKSLLKKLNKQVVESKTQSLTGVFYRGDNLDKYTNALSNEDDIKNGKLFYMNPETVSKYFKLNNSLADKYIFKIINFNDKGDSLYPVIMKKDDLMVWTIPPQRHQDYANFWISITVLNICSNLLVWTVL